MASVRADVPELAELTLQLAPDDPQTHYAAGVLYDRTFLPEDQRRSVAEYEEATALSPNNYLLWVELGKARTRNGDSEGAERALRKSLDLAPNYSLVHWALGNALLRKGDIDGGFAEIRNAVEGNGAFAAPAMAIAFPLFDGDVASIRRIAATSADIHAALAVSLAKQKRFDEAFQVWNEIPAEDKLRLADDFGKVIASSLLEAKRYRMAQSALASIYAEGADAQTIGQINNGEFEGVIKMQDAGTFEWHIADGREPQVILTDGQRHGGSRSLALLFNLTDAKNMRQISQLVTVEPGKTYDFQAFYRAELKTDAPPIWEIVSATDGKVLASTAGAINNTEWARMEAHFLVPGDSDAVTIRLSRTGCNSSICPISGRIWFDDLVLRPR